MEALEHNIIESDKKLAQYAEGSEFRNLKKRHRSIIKFLKPYIHDYFSILDIGSREGTFCNELRLNGYKDITATDINPRAIDILKKRNFEAKLVDVNTLYTVFKQHWFDLITASHVLEHCTDPQKVVDQLAYCANMYFFIEVPLETELNINSGHYSVFSKKKDLDRLLKGHTILKREVFKRKASDCYRVLVQR